MLLDGPYEFQIAVEEHDRYSLVCNRGGTTFHAPVTQRCPKLYVFADDKKLLYIGQTVQSMSTRMRMGFKADGTSGYHGYRWRTVRKKATCHVWCLRGVTREDELHTLECIESEVVFGYRKRFDQWPPFQTEIHFHQSNSRQRELAKEILKRFPGK